MLSCQNETTSWSPVWLTLPLVNPSFSCRGGKQRRRRQFWCDAATKGQSTFRMTKVTGCRAQPSSQRRVVHTDLVCGLAHRRAQRSLTAASLCRASEQPRVSDVYLLAQRMRQIVGFLVQCAQLNAVRCDIAATAAFDPQFPSFVDECSRTCSSKMKRQTQPEGTFMPSIWTPVRKASVAPLTGPPTRPAASM